jgi:hypothetical protein
MVALQIFIVYSPGREKRRVRGDLAPSLSMPIVPVFRLQSALKRLRLTRWQR